MLINLKKYLLSISFNRHHRPCFVDVDFWDDIFINDLESDLNV